MQPIIRTKDETEFGLALRYVFGLNIFAANGVEVSTDDDPRVIFLRTLCEQHDCSAHTGNLLDVADDPQELFGPADGKNSYVLVRTGVYKGSFYDADGWATFPACFFPLIRDNFWEMQASVGGSVIEEMLDWDALALYVSPCREATAQIRSLIERPFSSHEGWLQQVSKLYQLVVLTISSGWYIEVYSQDTSSFALLGESLKKAVEAIKAHSWYKAHSTELIWDSEYEMCLLLPELLRERA